MTTTRTLSREEIFSVPPETLFALLHTPSAIRTWWNAARAIVIAEEGGFWAAAWGEEEDDPAYITSAEIDVFHPPRRLVLTDYRYYAQSGALPFQAALETLFEVEPHWEGALLRVTQSGFPCAAEADDFFAACESGWRDTFAGIRRFLSRPDASGTS